MVSRVHIAATVAGLISVLAACGQTDGVRPSDTRKAPTPATGTPAEPLPTGPFAPPVTEWAVAFCTAVGHINGATGGQPDNDPRAWAIAELTQLGDGVGTAITGLSQLQPSPVLGGDDAVRRLIGKFTTERAWLTESRDRLSRTSGGDQAGMGRTLGEVMPRRAAFTARPLDGVAIPGEIRGAAARSGQCPYIGGFPR
ncbi:hypothetical protein EV193_109244 [Herbihabitans rhizosphaerae]|uniref:Uncharacterized protein n=1 Tax=Herbihabitans rhizosphaerae TaxID=1872711 RepID=A0A4Q7KGS0_9PSEU|nr:hypothetical protein [Herbihabitans rhizosphaerae]RZS34453.1 hypothetical protein EV193_109244 [Herbihabitans rhizosphaerae]